MAERRVPAFLSRKLHSLSSTPERKELLDQYDIWKCDNITKEYILFLESKLEHLIKEEEEKTDWLSKFHWKFKQAHDKGKRSVLRLLLKDFK